jgi:hypothetical protein
MDVSVRYKRGQRLRSAAKPSVLGNGLLERARSTSLALLGLTAAVGLAMVALALNQGWPLIAGGPIPQIPPRHQGVGEATIAAGVQSRANRFEPVAAGPRPGKSAAADGGTQGGDSSGRPADTGSTEASELVVSPSAPAKPQGDGSDDAPDHNQPPATGKPKQVSANPTPTAQSPVRPESPSPSMPQSSTEPTRPVATTSEAPEESGIPSESNGKGNDHGHDDDWDDDDWDDDDWDDDDHDWDHGHGHGHDHDWDDD